MFTFRIKLILAAALLAIVTAFGVTYLRGQFKERAAREAAAQHAEEALSKGEAVPP